MFYIFTIHYLCKKSFYMSITHLEPQNIWKNFHGGTQRFRLVLLKEERLSLLLKFWRKS